MSLATRIQIAVAKADVVICELGKSAKEALPIMLIMLALFVIIALIKRHNGCD